MADRRVRRKLEELEGPGDNAATCVLGPLDSELLLSLLPQLGPDTVTMLRQVSPSVRGVLDPARTSLNVDLNMMRQALMLERLGRADQAADVASPPPYRTLASLAQWGAVQRYEAVGELPHGFIQLLVQCGAEYGQLPLVHRFVQRLAWPDHHLPDDTGDDDDDASYDGTPCTVCGAADAAMALYWTECALLGAAPLDGALQELQPLLQRINTDGCMACDQACKAVTHLCTWLTYQHPGRHAEVLALADALPDIEAGAVIVTRAAVQLARGELEEAADSLQHLPSAYSGRGICLAVGGALLAARKRAVAASLPLPSDGAADTLVGTLCRGTADPSHPPGKAQRAVMPCLEAVYCLSHGNAEEALRVLQEGIPDHFWASDLAGFVCLQLLPSLGIHAWTAAARPDDPRVAQLSSLASASEAAEAPLRQALVMMLMNGGYWHEGGARQTAAAGTSARVPDEVFHSLWSPLSGHALCLIGTVDAPSSCKVASPYAPLPETLALLGALPPGIVDQWALVGFYLAVEPARVDAALGAARAARSVAEPPTNPFHCYQPSLLKDLQELAASGHLQEAAALATLLEWRSVDEVPPCLASLVNTACAAPGGLTRAAASCAAKEIVEALYRASSRLTKKREVLDALHRCVVQHLEEGPFPCPPPAESADQQEVLCMLRLGLNPRANALAPLGQLWDSLVAAAARADKEPALLHHAVRYLASEAPGLYGPAAFNSLACRVAVSCIRAEVPGVAAAIMRQIEGGTPGPAGTDRSCDFLNHFIAAWCAEFGVEAPYSCQEQEWRVAELAGLLRARGGALLTSTQQAPRHAQFSGRHGQGLDYRESAITGLSGCQQQTAQRLLRALLGAARTAWEEQSFLGALMRMECAGTMLSGTCSRLAAAFKPMDKSWDADAAWCAALYRSLKRYDAISAGNLLINHAVKALELAKECVRSGATRKLLQEHAVLTGRGGPYKASEAVEACRRRIKEAVEGPDEGASGGGGSCIVADSPDPVRRWGGKIQGR